MGTHDRGAHLAILALLVAACGSSGAPTAPAGPGATGGSGGPGGPSTTAATGPGSDGPVIATLAGVTYGFPDGTCDVTNDEVRTSAGGMDGGFVSIDVAWARDGSSESFRVLNTSTASGPPAPFDLYADPTRPGTTWDVQVTGTTAMIQARMRNELPAAQGDPALAEYDVTIRIDCAERAFGVIEPTPTDAPAPTGEAVPTLAGEASVAVALGDVIYQFSYYGCPLTEPTIGIAVGDASLNRLLVSGGAARLVLADGTTYQGEGVDFQGSGLSATWTGTMASSAGDATATISITC
jgi:hypothetical protein